MDDREPPEIDPNAVTRPLRTAPSVEPVPVAPLPARGQAPAPRVSVRVPYAHRFGSVPSHFFGRAAAFLIDWFAVAFVLATFGFSASQRGLFFLAARNASGFVALAGLAFGAAVIFAFFCEAVFGTTLGKLVFALHVRRGNGRHAGLGRVFLRTLLRPIDLLLIGPLLMLVTPRRQRLGDLVGGTVVARSTLGWFASILGLALVLALAYAQASFGGGIDSGIGVGAETADYAPGIIAAAATALGAHALPALGNGPTAPTAAPVAPTSVPAAQ